MSIVETTAERIIAAYKGEAIPPVRESLETVPNAYAVQQATVRLWLSQGRRIVGRKIGLTSKAVQSQLGVDEPDFGVIFEDMVVENGGVVAAGSVKQPRVEAEIAFVLGSDLDRANISAEDVMAATSYVCPALEICGSRIQKWDIKIADTIADNASAGMIVLGKSAGKLKLDELPAVQVRLSQNGAVAQEGRGAACLGNPAIAVAWLAETLARFGEGLKAGDIVMSGALAAMLPASPGDRFEADFGSFGSVAVSFAK
jgi:2-keto-4-pentenoate hydratase